MVEIDIRTSKRRMVFMDNIDNEIKYKKLFNILGRWVSLNESGYTVGDYLIKKNIKEVGIYGFGQTSSF